MKGCQEKNIHLFMTNYEKQYDINSLKVVLFKDVFIWKGRIFNDIVISMFKMK